MEKNRLKKFYVIKGKKYSSIKVAAEELGCDYGQLQVRIKRRVDSDGEIIRVFTEVVEIDGSKTDL